ncbi:MAG TPA: MDR family MFS transporter [Acetobacteraceae bacterium]|nr:MDR family MFS transporter [Acetobacteraceae bacterium]
MTVESRFDPSADPDTGGLPPARRRMLIGAMLVSTFMAAVEVTVISTAMPTIIARLGGFALFSWAFGIYLLAQAVMTPIYGRLADLYGRKIVYLGSTALFLVGSLLCGLAWSMPSLIAFRAIQGIGGGALTPLATIVVSDVCPPAERPRAFGQISAVWGISAIVGPVLGAFFVAHLTWSFVFWINLPIGAVAMTLVAKLLHEPGLRRRHRVDYRGAVLLMLSAGPLMLVLVQYGTLPVTATLALLAGGLVAAALLVRNERRASEPMLPVHLWRQRMVIVANLSALLCGALLIALTGFLPTYIQGVAGGSVLQAGMTLGVMSVSWTLASMAIGRFLTGFSCRSVSAFGGLAALIGSLGLLALTRGQHPAWLWGECVLLGVGLGLNSITFILAIQSCVGWSDRGRATSLFYFCRLFGQALGAAAFGGILNAGIMRAAPGAPAFIPMLVDAHQRAALSRAVLDHLVGVLQTALHGVYLAAAVVAIAAFAVTLLAPPGLFIGGSRAE